MQRMLGWVRENQGGTQGMSYQYWTEAMGGGENSPMLAQFSASRHQGETTMPLLLIHGAIDNGPHAIEVIATLGPYCVPWLVVFTWNSPPCASPSLL